MKQRIPKGRFDLKIKKSEYVLEVGPGHNPHPRSNILIEKFIDDNSHRCGDLVVRNGQKLLNYDGNNMPFTDKEFDYVICNHVLEHVDNPITFCKELSRVGKRGYLECPSIIGEFLFPKESHKWVIMQLDEKFYAFEKSKMPGNYIEWVDNIQIEIIDKESEIKKYFVEKWNRKMTELYSKKRNIFTELINISKALFYVIRMKLAGRH